MVAAEITIPTAAVYYGFLTTASAVAIIYASLQIRAACSDPRYAVWPLYGKDPRWLRVFYAVWYSLFAVILVSFSIIEIF